MKVEGLNKNHAKYLGKYIKCVQKIIYKATEHAPEGKFNEVNDLLTNVVRFANKFKEHSSKEAEINEWCYMIPNLMLYSSVGFLIGIKDKDSSPIINEAIDELFETTVTMTSMTTNILEDLEDVGELKKILSEYNKC